MGLYGVDFPLPCLMTGGQTRAAEHNLVLLGGPKLCLVIIIDTFRVTYCKVNQNGPMKVTYGNQPQLVG